MLLLIYFIPSGIKSVIDKKDITPLEKAREDIIIISFFFLTNKIIINPMMVDNPAKVDKVKPR